MPSEKTYLGKVVDNRDPLYQGRARINVFGLFDGIPDDDLPWAEQISGLVFGGTQGGCSMSIPRIGSVVAVEFEAGNYYKMNYHYLKEISRDLQEELKEDNSYEGTQALIYDSEAQPGTLKMIYTRKKGLVFQLGDATIQLDTQNAGTDSERLRIVLKLNDDEVRMEKQTIHYSPVNLFASQHFCYLSCLPTNHRFNNMEFFILADNVVCIDKCYCEKLFTRFQRTTAILLQHAFS
jgi:hypothetical protein